jgi:hypothetical protein
VTAGPPVAIPPRHRRRTTCAILTPRLPGRAGSREQAPYSENEDLGARVEGLLRRLQLGYLTERLLVLVRCFDRLSHAIEELGSVGKLRESR